MVVRSAQRAPARPTGFDRAIFAHDDPQAIALALKASAEANPGPRASALRSAMATLTFHINRAGAELPETRRRVLEAAKAELRKAFDRM